MSRFAPVLSFLFAKTDRPDHICLVRLHLKYITKQQIITPTISG